jgi:CHASE2 domain-containing sensor protein
MTLRMFISYRRDDVAKSTWRLFDWLERQFGAERVFFDRESIPPGEQFPRVLEEKLAASEVLIAVIGPRWASIADEAGPRLWQPHDYVAHEVATALAGKRKVIPVFVDGAAMPKPEELPPRLRAIADCEGLCLDDAHFREDFERLVDAILGRRRGFVRRQVDQMQRLVRFLKRGSVVVPLAALVAIFAAWIGLFGLLGLDTKLASYSIALAVQRTPVEHEERLVIVALDEESERRMGHEYDGAPLWRGLHARLIGRLAQAGAAVIVLDFFFERETEFDGELAQAIRAARKRGSRVVLAVKKLDAGKPRLAPALLAAGAEWGVACLGHREGYLFAAPLARAVDRQRAANPVTMLEGEPADTPALVLSAAFGGTPDLIRAGPREITLSGAGRGIAPVGFSTLERRARSRCPALADDDVVASRLLLLSPLEYWRDPARRHAYAQWLDPASPAANLQGKIVMVGITTESAGDEHSVRRGLASEDRFGVELQADAMRNLLSGFTLRPLDPAAQFLWMLALAILGAAASLFMVGRMRWARTSMLAAALAIYLAFDAAMLALTGVLLNPLYDLGAFLAAFSLLGRLERKTMNISAQEAAT